MDGKRRVHPTVASMEYISGLVEGWGAMRRDFGRRWLAGGLAAVAGAVGVVVAVGSPASAAVTPSYAATRDNWTTVMSAPGWADTSYWNGANLNSPDDPQGPAMVGRDPFYGDVARVYFQLKTGPIIGKHILRATFQITEKWANNCAASGLQLWLTGGVDKNTTWNHPASWSSEVDEVSVAKGNEAFGCGDGQVEFDATDAIRQAAAKGWSVTTFGLRASDENSTSGWKRFATDPVVAITYNSVPAAPSALSPAGKACVTGADRPLVGTATPDLSATLNDADAGTQLSATFSWAPVGGTVNSTDRVTQTNVATGSRAVVGVPAGRLAEGGSYFFQVQSTDGTDSSPVSGRCEFTVDTVAPDAAPVVSSVDYPADTSFHGGVGQTGAFTFGAAGVADVAGYQYGFADPPSSPVAAPVTGGAVTILATPPAVGLNTLYVRSVDRAGNLSPVTTYLFLAGSATGPVGWWRADEGGGNALSDATGNGHTATLSGGWAWAGGRTSSGGTDRAVTFNGSSGGAATAGPVLRTDTSYTVAAWVRLTTVGAFRTAISQQGSVGSAFYLQYDRNDNCWSLSLTAADATNPSSWRIVSGLAPRLGAWTHLAAVFDAGTGRASLYVNGLPAGSVAAPAPFQANGPLLIGRSLFNGNPTDFWAGDIDDVRAWQRVLPADEVHQLATAPVLIGRWDLDDSAGTATDSSGYRHDATVPAGATWTAGHNGAGALHLPGVTGVAATTAVPVVHTSASYTLTAWARLSDTAKYRGVLSQDGVHDSAFQLQYDASCTCWDLVLASSDVTGPVARVAAGPHTAAAGGWTFLAAVYDAGPNTISLYIDGQRVATVAGTATPWDAAGPFHIGQTRWNDADGSFFNGDIDNIAVYSGVLSDADIVNLYDQ